ncbi:sugar kinase [Microbacterium testaceum]|uniref:ADP-dependent NAD(P)H-hydrate dehydratase n=1 Tax=Microbacterium testaceum TaxID=2033 RepID=UPI000734F5CE|nr:ADP/ATP-dependent (S)-NAD(P)H-hydrate dehydratase [Microbacterium testaceum]KTS91241.1 sugar kinase [Microbacterium testaceum]
MASSTENVTLSLLREWGLPEPGGSKKSRGQVVVVGGSTRSPGGVLLSAEATLRVGAGRVGLAVPSDIAPLLGPAMPEAGVYVLPTGSHPLDDHLRSAVESANAVLLGPGFDDPDATRAALLAVADADVDRLVLDAFALGILPDVDRGILPDQLIINANEEEAALLLGRDLGDDRVADVREIAARFSAVVHCFGTVAAADGRAWRAEPGGSGLGTAGSGDVLAGAIAGFAALGMEPERAAVWGGWTHARAGDRLTERLGIGFLARDLLAELTAVVHDS